MKIINIFSVIAALFLVGCQTASSNNNCCPQCQPCGRGGGFGNQMGKGPRGMNRPTFEEVDKNKDGKITQEELNAFRADRMAKRAGEGRRLKNAGTSPSFEVLDKNKDGVLTNDEYPPAMPAGRGRGR
ncbi:MAG: EF-hand domain-containing protein [Bdellovibrionales bacterium]|nr:EF-hand domain-containing protein [Bdellovibrionales bacterium]